MFKLNRKTEYALLALRVLDQRPAPELVRAKTIAAQYGIAAQMMSKVLQSLKTRGIVRGTTGPQGGYRLNMSLAEITFADVLACFTESVGLVDCVEGSGSCQQDALCDIQTPMRILNSAVMGFLDNITVGDLFATGFHEPGSLSLARRAVDLNAQS